MEVTPIASVSGTAMQGVRLDRSDVILFPTEARDAEGNADAFVVRFPELSKKVFLTGLDPGAGYAMECSVYRKRIWEARASNERVAKTRAIPGYFPGQSTLDPGF